MSDVLLLDIPAYRAKAMSPMIEDVLLAGKILRNAVFWAKTGIRPRESMVFTRGLLTIGAALRKAGFDTAYSACVFDEHGNVAPRILEAIRAARVVGVSSITPAQPIADRVYRTVAQVNPDAVIIAGGYHPTALPADVLAANPDLDLVVCGEGEATMVELLKRDCSPEGVPGVAFRTHDGSIRIEAGRQPLRPGEIPLPDYSLLPEPLSHYDFNVSTARGCAYRCAFCANWVFWGAPRYQPTDAVVRELTYLDQQLPAGTLVHFTDNVFTQDRLRAIELCNRIRREGLRLLYSCDVRAGAVDPELIETMEAAGFRHVAIGFEDESPTILAGMRKGLRPDSNIETARMIRKNSNMAITAYWMVGLPGVSAASLRRSISVVRELIEDDVVDIVSPRIYVPYPGTDVFESAARFGVEIVDKDWSHYDRVTCLPVFVTRALGRHELYSRYVSLRAAINEAYMRKLGLSASKLQDAVSRAKQAGEWAYS